MWIYGAASDALAEIMGDDVPGLGHTDAQSGPNFGCGRSILIKNSDSNNPDLTALVMRKSRCPGDSNPQCARPIIHMDLMIPGFDYLGASASNKCSGPPLTGMSQAQSTVCGSGPPDWPPPADCTNCDQLPEAYINACKLFVEWGWKSGDPGWDDSTGQPMTPSPAQYKIVETPPKFIEYTKKNSTWWS